MLVLKFMQMAIILAACCRTAAGFGPLKSLAFEIQTENGTI